MSTETKPLSPCHEHFGAEFVLVDADGRLQIDLEKAGQAQRAGVVGMRIANHRVGDQEVTLKLGKLQALAALTKQPGGLVPKPKPGPTAEERCAACERWLDHRKEEHRRAPDAALTVRDDAGQIVMAPDGRLDARGVTAAPYASPRTPERVITADLSLFFNRLLES